MRPSRTRQLSSKSADNEWRLSKLISSLASLTPFFSLVSIAVLLLYYFPPLETIDNFLSPAIISIVTVLFILSNCLGTLAWIKLTDPEYKHIDSYGTACHIWMMSNISKYLPGNAAHHVHKYVFARGKGINSGSNLAGIMLEALILISTALAISTPYFYLSFSSTVLSTFDTKYELGFIQIFIGVAIAIIALLVFDFFFAHVRALRRSVWRHMGSLDLSQWLYAYSSYISCMLLAAAAAWIALYIGNDGHQASFFSLLSIYAIAFILGYILPGAPGGLGVREAAFVLLCTGILDMETAIALVLVLRLCSIIADVVCTLPFILKIRQNQG